MKELFKWYIPQSKEQIKEIWKNGILTIDTNVLLDLYRYHQDTREALLESLNQFKGRAWISNQVAEEFFRNRNGVILSSTSAFNDAMLNLAELRRIIEEPIRKMKSTRIIPDELGKKLEENIIKTISDAEGKIGQIKSQFPDYIKQDPILENICQLFDSSVGKSYESEILAEVLKEAKRRKDNKIPPGFKDSNKEGDKPYGDYILWRQILDHTKIEQKPLIFVTSEEKEDWWEKRSGKTVGPLYELIKEFHAETGQSFLLYRTSRFLEYATENSGKKTNPEAVAEIRDIATRRIPEAPLVRVVEQRKNVSSDTKAVGLFSVELLDNTYKFTCTGHFNPQLIDIPNLKVKLLQAPMGLPRTSIRFGTGTVFDFHVHLKSTDFGTYLPTGLYVFEYDAVVDPHNDNDQDSQ